ncbi:MAG: hypothetical protein A2Y12_01025 [Planctomycetes bacterium GWF2_42_9]|nr:MAG: hypothetical protein A2Y12_01025 [Planctomycetes bacterium GWF2_42_9]
MLTPGLTSITFRQLSSADIVKLAVDSDIRAIEWGSDIHVPIGDLKNAQYVRNMCADAGVTICSYGTYCNLEDAVDFQDLFMTAKALGTKTLRIWAGKLPSESADDSYKNKIVNNATIMAEQAAEYGLQLGFEFHRNTLTDSAEAAIWLLKQIAKNNVSTYWQPRIGAPLSENLKDIELLEPYLSNIHVFYWSSDASVRYLLKEGQQDWERYFCSLNNDKKNRYCLIEFVKDDQVKNFTEDGLTLNQLMKKFYIPQNCE